MIDYYKDAKFYLKGDWQKEYQEVTREEYIKAERAAGFHSTTGGDIATAAFNGNGISGTIKFNQKNKEN